MATITEKLHTVARLTSLPLSEVCELHRTFLAGGWDADGAMQCVYSFRQHIFRDTCCAPRRSTGGGTLRMDTLGCEWLRGTTVCLATDVRMLTKSEGMRPESSWRLRPSGLVSSLEASPE